MALKDSFWMAPAIGLIVGSAPGGTADKGKDKEKGQGYWTPFGLGVWLYGGFSAGIGKKFGPYATGGLMAGSSFDIGIGCGLQYNGWGLGIIVPVFETMKTMHRHQDKVAVLLDQGQHLLMSAQYYAGQVLQTLPTLGGLEQVITG